MKFATPYLTTGVERQTCTEKERVRHFDRDADADLNFNT